MKKFVLLIILLIFTGCANSIISKPDIDSNYTKFLNDNNFDSDYTITVNISKNDSEPNKFIFSKKGSHFARAAYKSDGTIGLRSFDDERTLYSIDESGSVKKDYIKKGSDQGDDLRRIFTGILLFRKTNPEISTDGDITVEKFEKDDDIYEYKFKNDKLVEVKLQTKNETLTMELISIEKSADESLFMI